MEPQLTGKRTIKVEIPLPRLPHSPFHQFSLKTIVIVVAVAATGLASYRLARETERARHRRGYFQLIVSTPYGMSSGLKPLDKYPDFTSVVRSAIRAEHRGNDNDLPVEKMWPPKIWIKRVDWKSPGLETQIDIEVGGTYVAPDLRTVESLKYGDRVFVSYGTP
jgi:hypothetical protein